MLQWKIFRYRWMPLIWFLMMCILFFLPGSLLPKENGFFSLLRLDKLVHIALFSILVFLIKTAYRPTFRAFNPVVLLATGLYGCAVEFIQRDWIPGRSFDLYDIMADLIGSIAGLIFWLWLYKKNKPL